MFQYPILLPSSTEYDELGIGPEALSKEIAEAKGDLARTVTARKDALRAELDSIYIQVDGLREAYANVSSLEVEQADSHHERLAEARESLARLEARARKIDPTFTRRREELAEFDTRLERINLMAVLNPEKRVEYDQKNPPLALMKLADCVRDRFATDRKTALTLLRRELSEFLASREVDVSHPSDLTREDFTADFTETPLLDGSAK